MSSFTAFQNQLYKLGGVARQSDSRRATFKPTESSSHGVERDFEFVYRNPVAGMSTPAQLSSELRQTTFINLGTQSADHDADDEGHSETARRLGRQRAKLLAMKYTSKSAQTAELLARLELMAARLDAEAPRVTAKHLDLLDAATDRALEMRERRLQLARELGL